MAVALVYLPVLHFVDDNGNPVASGKLYSYLAGTSTPAALYADPLGTTPLPNPADLDASGRLVAYATIGQAYKLDVRDVNDAVVDGDHYPIDNYVVTPFSSPSLIGPPYTTVNGMHTYLDPGEVGTEVLPTSLLQWTQQIQHVLKDSKRTAQWETTFRTSVTNVSAQTQATENALWTAAGTTVINFRFIVPADWDGSTALALKMFRRFNTAGGVAKMFWNYTRLRDNTALSTSGNGVIDITHVDGLPHLETLTMTGVTLAAGDAVSLSVTRQGDDAGDTNTGTIICDAHWLAYTRYA